MNGRKSVLSAFVLTVFLGPLGLMYVSLSQGFFGLVIALLMLPLPGSMSFIGLMFLWAACILDGVTTAAKINRGIDAREELEERRHQELVSATRAEAIRQQR